MTGTIETRRRLTADVEPLVVMCDESGGGREWDSANARTFKARCVAKKLSRRLGRRSVLSYMNHAEITVTAAEADEIQDGDLIVPPFAEAAIDGGLDCAFRVVGRGEPYVSGGDVPANGVPVGQVVEASEPSPRVQRAPRGRYVTLKLAPGTVDAEDVEEPWPGERRMKPGHERWIPARFRTARPNAA